jgi:hypothetical protein
VNPALAGVAVAVVIGAVVAGSARNARTALLGLVAVMLFCPFLAEPTAQPLGLAARLVGATLAGYLLWIAARGSGVWTGGSLLGWPSDLLVAAAAAAVGYGSHGLGAPAVGPAAAQAAGFAVAALSVTAVANGRDIVRVGTGLVLLASGAILVRTALGGTPEPLEQVVIAGLVATLGGAVAVLAVSARAAGVDFELAPDRAGRVRRASDAHPIEPHPTDGR